MSTQVAEESCGLINRALGDFRYWLAEDGAASSRLPHGRLGNRRQSTTTWRAQSVVMTIVSIAEEFAMSRLYLAAAAVLPQDNPPVAWLWDTHFEGIRDWRGRKRTWRGARSVDIDRDFSDWAVLDAFVQVRNVVAHNLGRLSRKQLRNLDARAELEKHLTVVGITVADNRLVLDRTHVERCAEVSKQFVLWLDAAAK